MSPDYGPSYQYDPMGRRQMLTEDGVTTTFLHDGDEEIADYAAATVLRRYVPGPGTDIPIAMVTPSGGSNVRNYFHTNRQGSTITMSADSGTLSEGPYTYDAYGNGAPATGVPFKYTGRRLDGGTGLYYYRARYYSSSLGRFLQVDPVGYCDNLNLYAYVGGDPINAADPSGLREEEVPDAPTPEVDESDEVSETVVVIGDRRKKEDSPKRRTKEEEPWLTSGLEPMLSLSMASPGPRGGKPDHRTPKEKDDAFKCRDKCLKACEKSMALEQGKDLAEEISGVDIDGDGDLGPPIRRDPTLPLRTAGGYLDKVLECTGKCYDENCA